MLLKTTKINKETLIILQKCDVRMLSKPFVKFNFSSYKKDRVSYQGGWYYMLSVTEFN